MFICTTLLCTPHNKPTNSNKDIFQLLRRQQQLEMEFGFRVEIFNHFPSFYYQFTVLYNGHSQHYNQPPLNCALSHFPIARRRDLCPQPPHTKTHNLGTSVVVHCRCDAMCLLFFHQITLVQLNYKSVSQSSGVCCWETTRLEISMPVQQQQQKKKKVAKKKKE